MQLQGGFPLNTLGLAHSVMTRYVPTGGYCIDATAGRGRDTVLLCRLVGAGGRVVALDIQPKAVAATQALVDEQGWGSVATVVQDSHSHISQYAQPESVDCIVFNLGWLPGGDHSIFTTADSSIPALASSLELLRSGGVLSLSIYYGDGKNGCTERDAVLAWLGTLDDKRYTALVGNWANRGGDPPIPVVIFKE